MANLVRYGAVAAFALLVIVSGVLHGIVTHRWTEPPPLDDFVKRLDAIPEKFGTWTSEVSPDSDGLRLGGRLVTPNPRTGKPEYRLTDNLQAHGIADYTLRVYRNQNSTESYQVLVVCGRPGPVAAHTPDVCYRGSGFIPLGEQKRADVTAALEGGQKRNFPLYFLKYAPPKTKMESYEMEIRWAWIPPGQGLSAPDMPRAAFNMEPALYKVYIIHERPITQFGTGLTASSSSSSSMQGMVQPAGGSAATQDSNSFLQEFLPRLEDALKQPEQ